MQTKCPVTPRWYYEQIDPLRKLYEFETPVAD